jgi:hypothetical protein
MFGKFKLDPPKLDPAFVEAVRAAMAEAEEKFLGGRGEAKRAWVHAQVGEAARRLDLGNVPTWLADPVRDAVVYVVIESVWALIYRKKGA